MSEETIRVRRTNCTRCGMPMAYLVGETEPKLCTMCRRSRGKDSDVSPTCPWCKRPFGVGGYECGSGWTVQNELKQSDLCKHIASLQSRNADLARQLMAAAEEKAKTSVADEYRRSAKALNQRRVELEAENANLRRVVDALIDVAGSSMHPDRKEIVRLAESVLRAPGGDTP